MFPVGDQLRADLVKFLLKTHGWFHGTAADKKPRPDKTGACFDVWIRRFRINSSD
jgi:hypothetical protein